jgi:predicted regulator of Ras-like GTPase activity (Roadblock/LC7/MglB family)
MQSVLSALKDIPGVVGSFVLNPQGVLVAREMPGIFPDTVFPNLGRRLASVIEAMETQVSAVQDLLMKFEGHWLFVRRSAQGFLTILTSDTTNFPALRMASNVALKQVTEHLIANPPVIAVPAASDVAEPSSPAPLPPAAAPAAEAPKKRRMWRGQWVD